MFAKITTIYAFVYLQFIILCIFLNFFLLLPQFLFTFAFVVRLVEQLVVLLTMSDPLRGANAPVWP